MKIKRKIIQIDEEKCDGCGQCVPSCAEGAIQIVDGKARLAAEKYCDGLGACLGECPKDALHVVEREADDFDEKAVEEHLQKSPPPLQAAPTMACGCPSTQIQSFARPVKSCEEANKPASHTGSALGPLPLAGADKVGAADRAIPERGGSAGRGRLHPLCLSRFPSRFSPGQGAHGRMPEIRRRRGLHPEIHRYFQNVGGEERDGADHGSALLSGAAGDRQKRHGGGQCGYPHESRRRQRAGGNHQERIDCPFFLASKK